MKQILLMIAVVMGQSVLAADEKLIADPIVEKAVRYFLEKPEGELTEADLEKVTGLLLDNTKITDDSLKELAKLQKLGILLLGSTQVTDEGLKEIAKLRKVYSLSLIHTRITDKGLKELAKMQHLTQLELSGTQVTKAGVAELEKALPNCGIIGP